MTKNKKEISIKGIAVNIISEKDDDYICLTDMAKFKSYESGIVIANWLTTKYTVQFMGAWEQLYNPKFNLMEFHNIKNEVGTMGLLFLHLCGSIRPTQLASDPALGGMAELMLIKTLPLNLQLGFHPNSSCI